MRSKNDSPPLNVFFWMSDVQAFKPLNFKKGCKTKNEKLKEHAIAAAILLQSYLDHLHFAIQEGQTEN